MQTNEYNRVIMYSIICVHPKTTHYTANHNISTTKQHTAKPCDYFMEYILFKWWPRGKGCFKSFDRLSFKDYFFITTICIYMRWCTKTAYFPWGPGSYFASIETCFFKYTLSPCVIKGTIKHGRKYSWVFNNGLKPSGLAVRHPHCLDPYRGYLTKHYP